MDASERQGANNTAWFYPTVCGRFLRKVLLLMALPLLVAPAFAQSPVCNWTNGSGGNWNNAANWDCGFVPNASTHTANITLAGTYTVTLDTSVDLGSFTLGTSFASVDNQTLLIGSNTFALSGPGTVNIDGIVNFSGGTIGGASTLTVNGAMNWTGGRMAPGGTTVIGTGATLSLDGTANKELDRTLTNDGTTIWTNTGDLIGGGGTGETGLFDNNGVFDAQNDEGMSSNCCGTTLTFTNDGTFQKTAGVGTTTMSVPFTNNGSIDLQTGTTAFGSTFTQSAAGTFLLNGGGASSSGTLVIAAGTFGGTGTFTGNLQNDALVHPGLSPGLLTVTGNYTQGATGTLAIELEGTTAGTTYDQLAVGGAATLDGTLDVTYPTGFIPANGDTFSILTHSSRVGDFATKNGLNPAPGVTLTPSFTATSYDLVATAPPGMFRFPVNDDGSAEIGFQSCQGYTPGVECDPPFAGTGGLTTAAIIGDDTNPCLRFTVLSFDLSTLTLGDVYQLFLVESLRQGDPFATLGSGQVIIEVTTSTSEKPSRSEAVAAGFTEIARVTEAEFYSAGGIDLSGAINTILSAPHDQYLHMRFRFVTCVNGNSSNDQSRIAIGVGNPDRAHIFQTPASADLSITKSASPEPVASGGMLTYTVQISNSGPDTSSLVELSDSLPAGVTFVSAGGTGWSCSESAGVVTCTMASLPVGAASSITITTAAPATPGPITNTATVSAATSDPDSANNSASVVSNVIGGTSADLRITKVSDPPSVAPGDTIRYGLVVTNAGPDVASSINVTDALPAGTSFVSAAGAGWTCLESSGTVVCNTASLGSGQTSEIFIIVGAPETAGAIVNQASVSSATADPVPASNVAQARTIVETPVECPSPVSLISPANGETGVPASGALSWSDAAADSYSVYLGEGAGGCSTLLGTTASTTMEYGGLEPRRRYNWRVVANKDGCAPSPSICSSFDTCDATAPSLLTPAADSEQVSTVLFEWSEVTGAVSYDLFLGFGDAEPVLTASTSSTTVAADDLSVGSYRWFVVAHFEHCSDQTSAMGTFRVLGPCEMPLEVPVVSVPGEVNSGEDYSVQWGMIEHAASYEIQESLDESFDTPTSRVVDHLSAGFNHLVEEPTAYFYRVRAICDESIGPFSLTGRIVVVPLPDPAQPPTLTTEFGNTDEIRTEMFVEFPAEAFPEEEMLSFAASSDESWLRIMPQSGVIMSDGVFLTLIIDPSGLPVGTSSATVTVEFGLVGKSALNTGSGSTKSTTVSVSLVTPVTLTHRELPPSPNTLIIPAVAHVDGIRSQWQSNIRLTNTGSSPVRYVVSFAESGADITAVGKLTIVEAGPDQTIALDDVVRQWFGQGSLGDGTIGTLEIRPLPASGKDGSTEITKSLASVASSRTFNTTSTGTLGQFVPAVPFAAFIGGETAGGAPVLGLNHLSESIASRTNIGLVEGAGGSASVEMRLFSDAGELLRTFAVDLLPGEHRQLNGFLADHDINLDSGRLELEVVEGTGRITGYASVVDNLTNDPTLVPAIDLSSIAATRYVVPGVADFTTAQNRWRTTMTVFNAGETPAVATLTFYPQNEPSQAMAVDRTIAPGEMAVLENLLSEVFDVRDTGGVVHVTTPAQSSLVVTARTFDREEDGGTVGQFIGAVTPAESFGIGDRPLQVLQLEESARFRSNLGLAEVTGRPVTVEIAGYKPGALADRRARIELEAFEFRQLTSVMAQLGLGTVYNGRITIKVVEGDGLVTAYGSVVDNQTQDPTFVPAQ